MLRTCGELALASKGSGDQNDAMFHKIKRKSFILVKGRSAGRTVAGAPD